jgi:nicotinamidase-related amidase
LPHLSQRETSQLVIVDVQEKLCGVMQSDALATTIKNCDILIQAAQLLEIPIICTEQYPKGLGATVPELAQDLGAYPRIEKTCFSCFDSSQFRSRLRGDRPQIILAGMEAHICVLQTALQLQETGKQVFVVEDAVISRNPLNKTNALLRLRQAGVIVSNTESIVFEWLRVAEGDAFKQISRLVR